MPKKPSSPSTLSSTAAKKNAPTPPSKKAPADEEALDDEDLIPEVLEDEEDLEDAKTPEEDEVIPGIEEVEKAIDEKEEEEEPVDEEAILAKGDELEILNLLAKKANRMEQGLDDDELIPDEEGMNSF